MPLLFSWILSGRMLPLFSKSPHISYQPYMAFIVFQLSLYRSMDQPDRFINTCHAFLPTNMNIEQHRKFGAGLWFEVSVLLPANIWIACSERYKLYFIIIKLCPESVWPLGDKRIGEIEWVFSATRSNLRDLPFLVECRWDKLFKLHGKAKKFCCITSVQKTNKFIHQTIICQESHKTQKKY